MSYSFQIRAAGKHEALIRLDEEIEKVVASQPEHRADRHAISAGGIAALTALAYDAEKDVYLNIQGSLSSNDAGVQNVGTNVSAGLIVREPAS